jgi:hypothetical protein
LIKIFLSFFENFFEKSHISIYVKQKTVIMNKSQRIYANTGATQTSKYIKFQLEQDVDTIEFMTMNIYTKDAYQDFNSDYGVLVGRVTANGGVGIPNAKISIFIPLTDVDAEIGQINSIYPYRTPRDKNAQGKRYNLLPRIAEYEPSSGTYSPKQPFGSFPIKPEIVTNQYFLDVYKKYYKYTALTNSAGDYMIFGVPVGTQTVHLSVDITDIGKYSMNPASMVTNLGYSPNLFMDNNSKIKPSNDLNDLPNIETQEISVDIIPFWGDTTNFSIGITQQDFRIRAVLDNTFVIFGSAFTDGDNSMWGANDDSGAHIRELYRIRKEGEPEPNYNVSMLSKRNAIITEKIYYYPSDISDAKIDTGNVNPEKDMLVLDPTEYSVYKREGDFVFIVSCNRNKIVTDDFGNEIPVPPDSINGIFTKFRGFAVLEITVDAAPMPFSEVIGGGVRIAPYRYKVKIPQYAPLAYTFSPNENFTGTTTWRKQNFTFRGGELYSISNFNSTVVNTEGNDARQGPVYGPQYGLLQEGTNPGATFRDMVNEPYNNGTPNRDYRYQTGIILTNDVGVTGNTLLGMPYNANDNAGREFFGGNWLNLTLYLPQFSYVVYGYSDLKYIHTTSNFAFNQYNFQTSTDNFYYLYDNTQPIAAGESNTKWFARSDLHWTDFIKLTKRDILNMNATQSKGIVLQPIQLSGSTYRNGTYTPPQVLYNNWNAPCPYNGGKEYINGIGGADPNIYFYKGYDTADCIEYIISLGLV